MPAIEINTEYQTVKRFPAWIALAVFSAISVAAAQSQLPADASSGHKWSLAVCWISLIGSVGASGGYIAARGLFASTPIETAVTGVLLAFWGAGLPVIMNPNRGIAVDAVAVENANLYFGAWTCVAALVYIAASLAQEVSGVNVRELAPGNIFRWYCLAVSSIIVLVSSVRYYNARDCSNQYLTYDENCKRTKFAISVGVISFVGSFVVAYWIQNGLGQIVEFFATILLLIFWCFGVGFITFGTSPGSEIGNLYFATWISFVLIVVLFADAFQSFMSHSSQDPNREENNDHHASGQNGESPEIPAEEDI